jgi:tetratricopeptide (TPR) repeat protein
VKRINLKFLLILIAVVVAGTAGIYFLRRFQISRNAGNLATQAKARLEEGKTADAIMLYGRYLGLRPEDSQAHAELARLMLARAEAPDATRNDMARAYNSLEAAVRKNPEDDDLRRRLAEFQLRIGRAVDAREHLAVLRERFESGQLKAVVPDEPVANDDDAEDAADEPRRPLDGDQIQLMTAQSFMRAGDFEEAGKLVAEMVGFDLGKRAFDPALKKSSGATEAYIMLAAILEERLADKQASSTVLEQLVEVQSKDVKAWLARSSWHRQHGNLDAAEADILTALDLDPDSINAVFAGYELALARQDYDEAWKLASKGRELAPRDERAYRGLAAVALQRGDLETAEQVLLDGIELLPDKASLLLMLADTLLQQNKLEQVDQSIARIKELYGDSSPAVGLLEARLLVARRKWADAKSLLEKVRPLVLGSQDLVRQVDLYLAQCHAQLDEPDAQLEVNRRVLSEDPASLAARAGAAAALATAGKTDEALAEFERIASVIPLERLASVPQVWYPLLQLRIQQQAKLPVAERDWSGIDSLLDALQQSPGMTATQLSLLRADVLVRKGETDSAREILEQAAAGGESGPPVWAALTTLALRTDGPEAALAVLERAPAATAASAPLLTVRAQVAGARKDEGAKDAIIAVEALTADLPDEEAANVLMSIAAVHVARGDVESADRVWRAVSKRQPDDIRSREAILELALNQDDLEKARAAAADVAAVAGGASARSRVAEAGVKIFEVRQSRGKRQKEGDSDELTPEEKRTLEEARNLLIEAENDRPGWSQIQTLYAEIDSLRGDELAAIERLKKAVTMGAANPAIMRRLVALLYTVNRLDEAQQYMESMGLEGAQGSDRLTAEMQLRAGKFDEAAEIAERTVPSDSSNAEDLLWLGQLLDRAGKTERASEVLTRATEVDPQRSDIWLALFSHQINGNKKPAAERTLEKAVELMPEPQRQLAKAQGYEMLGRNEDAEQAFREAVAVAPKNLETSRGLAAFLVRSGRLQPARETLQAIIDSPDTSAAAESTKAWGRRLLAELIAERGNFREMGQAMELLQQNVDDRGEITVDDSLLQVKLLTNRPEPASWKQAIKVFEELSRKQPLVMGQRIMLAQLRERVGRWDECRNDLIAVVAAPNVPPAYVAMLVEKMIDHGEVSAARPWLARLQKMSPDTAITIALEAKLAIAENDRKLAADAARKLMPGGVISGSEPTQLNAVARLMEQLGFPKAADKVFAQYAELSADGVIARADFLGRQKRSQEALDLLEARWNELPLEQLLTAAVQIVRVQDAPADVAPRIEPWFTKAKRVDPGSIVIQLLEAELLALEGRTAEAEKMYRGLLANSDMDAKQKAIVSNNLAFHLAKAETAAEAKKLVEAAIEELGPLPDLLDTRGMIRLAAGENREAVTDFEEAVLQPTDVKFLHLAFAQLQAGDQAGARTSLEFGRRKGLQMSRLSPEDKARLGKLEEALGTKVSTPAATEPQG